MVDRKITLIYLGRKGGAVPYSFEMTRALLEKGVKMQCVLSELICNKQDWIKLAEESDNLELIILPTYTNRFRFIKSLFFDREYNEAIDKIRSFNPDSIYLSMVSLNARKFVKKLSDIPLVTTIHDFNQHLGDRNFIIQKIFDYILNHSKKIVVLTKSYAELASCRYGVPMHNIQHIPHANFSYYNKENKAPQFDKINYSILFFGRISKYKGISVLLQSMKTIIKAIPDIKLVISGKGNLDSTDMEIVNSYPQNIELKNGWLPDSKVWNLFSDSDMTIAPYIDASQSGVVAVSLGAGRMVVASDSGGLREQVEPSGGVVVESGNSEELAHSIISLYENPDSIKERNRFAYEYAMSELTWDRSASLLLDLIYNR